MNAEELMKSILESRYSKIRAILEKEGWPETINSLQISSYETENKYSLRGDMNAGMKSCGYGVLKNQNSRDGRWKVNKKNATMYFKLPAKAE